MYATDLFNDVAIWYQKRYLQCFMVVVGSRIEFVELSSLQSCLFAWLQMKLLVQISRGKELLMLSNNLHVTCDNANRYVGKRVTHHCWCCSWGWYLI